MRLLIIGGTIFLGRHLVTQALAAGHQVTTLNRGTVYLEEQERAERLIADRNGDLSVLAGRTFDAVIDTCAYHPDSIEHSIRAMAGTFGTYVFISTVSAFGDFSEIALSEESPIKYTPLGHEGDYGSLKADCEQRVTELIPDRALIIRPGLIVGPYDPTDRFTYWPSRFARGGAIAVPDKLDKQVQFIDVRDLAAWIIARAEAQARGIYIATGPLDRLTLRDVLDECQNVARVDSQMVKVDELVLLKAEIKPWTELPLWIPDTMKNFAGIMRLDRRKAVADGLTCRKIRDTIADTLAWDKTRDPSLPRDAGLSPERELELLRQPKHQQKLGRGPLPGAGLK
jgi:2'-hydroxyisoflavone reductase